MEKRAIRYNFKGPTEETINSILSLLFGKEFYQEISLYSNFINDSQPESYQKKISSILDLMQRENLILIRENQEEGGIQIINLANEKNSANNEHYSKTARVYLRQHGKDVLTMGGYKISGGKHKLEKTGIELNIPLRSKLVIILILIAALSYII